MSKATKAIATKVSTPSNNATENVALFGAVNAPITVQSLRAWVNSNAGGNWSNVKIVPQANIVADYVGQGLKGPVPFGYNGNSQGTRAILQNHILSVQNLAQHWLWCKTQKGVGTVAQHTPNNPVCLLALLNGGYSASQATYGTPFIHLVVAQ